MFLKAWQEVAGWGVVEEDWQSVQAGQVERSGMFCMSHGMKWDTSDNSGHAQYLLIENHWGMYETFGGKKSSL